MATPSNSKRHQLLDLCDLSEILGLLKKHGYSGVDYETLGLRLGLRFHTLDAIEANNKDFNGRLTECLAEWLQKADDVKKRGGPTYHVLIQVLRKMGENAVADGIDKEISSAPLASKVQPTPAANRIQEIQSPLAKDAVRKWMEEGSIDLTVTRVNMLGAPGAGKTCSLRLLLNEDPLTNDTSTPISCPTFVAKRVAVCDRTIWNRVTRANLLDKLAADLDAVLQQKRTEPPLPVVLSMPDNTQPATEMPPDPSPTPQKPNQEALSVIKDIKEYKEYHTEAVVQEILASQSKGICKSDHWLYVTDFGGSPAYQELLPLFTRAASLNIITLDLSKPFNERFDLMYRIDGQYFPCHSKSTQLAFFQSAVLTGTSFKPLDISCISKEPTHSMHLVLGTHYDKVSDATLKEKEEILKSSMSSLESYLQNCVIHQSDDSIIFPVNTIAESEERAKYTEKICKAIWYCGSDASLKIKIPIRWFAFELSLPKQSIISVKEALSIGERYGMNEEDTKQALRYFHDVSLMLYYPEVTDVIFISSKPLLEILSQLLALTYIDNRYARALILIKPVPQIVVNNLKEGFFNGDIFDHLKSRLEVFSHPWFQLPNLIKLLLHLNIITKLEDEPKGHYFIPYALPSYNEPVSIEETNAKPLLIVWREEESKEILPVPTGLFPLTITHLLNQKEFVTEISPSMPKYYKFRDAMSLKITFKGKEDTLHLINHYTHIEVYFTGPTQHCPLVRKLLTTAIDNSSDAMHLKHNYVNAFACPSKRSSCYCIIRPREDGNIVNCTVCPVSATISSDHWYWFESGPVGSNEADEIPWLDKKPELKDLFRLFKSSAVHYILIGTALDVKVDDLLSTLGAATTNLILVFQRWIDSNKGVTWESALQACKDYPEELGRVKADVESFLSSNRAYDKYLKDDKKPRKTDPFRLFDIEVQDGLKGVRVVEKNSFLIDGESAQSVKWEEYGIRITIPQGAVLPSDTVQVTITALVGGDFIFPEDTELVSAVYAISASKPFLEPVKLEIQHCVSIETSSQCNYLSFATSTNNQPPYHFNTKVDVGDFCIGNRYGSNCSINITTFSKYCIIRGEPYSSPSLLKAHKHDALSSPCAASPSVLPSPFNDELHSSNSSPSSDLPHTLSTKNELATLADKPPIKCYHSQVLYEIKRPGREWLMRFLVSKDLNALIKYVRKTFSNVEKSIEVFFQFKDDDGFIKLHFDEKCPKGWLVMPHQTPTKVSQTAIDRYGSMSPPRFPECLITITATPGEGAAKEMSYPVTLQGIKETDVEKMNIVLTMGDFQQAPAKTIASLVPSSSDEREQVVEENDPT